MRQLLTFAFLIVFLISNSYADTAADIVERLQPVLDAEFAKSKVTPGASLCVILPGGEHIAVTSGKDRLGSRGRALTANDNFRLASISKTYLSTAVSELATSGLVQFDAPAKRYIKRALDMKRIPNGSSVTVRQLLGMTSGIPDYLYTDGFDQIYTNNPKHHWTAEETIRLVYGLSPKFTPGRGFFYSNTNYNLLGLMLTKIRNQSLAKSLRELIFVPLGLADTFVEFESAERKLTTHGYEFDDDDRLVDVSAFNDGLGLGDGGIISTPCDVARFIKALFVDRSVLSTGQLTQMVSFGKKSLYGLGVEQEITDFGETWTHNGASSGYQGEYYYFPSSGLVWVLLTNSFETDLIEPVFAQTIPILIEYLPQSN